jgi:hypothetical protein
MAERSIRLRGSAVLAMTLASGCGGADTSSTAVSGICRVYASSVTATTTTSFTGMSSTAAIQNVTASYNAATNQLSEMSSGTSNDGMCQNTTSWSTNYGSVQDFTDEVSVIPPKTRWASQSGMATYRGPSPPCANGTFSATTTSSYDGQGRLTRSTTTGAGIRFRSMVAASAGADNIYTTWDVAGRPTAYQFPDGFGAMVHLSYDDSARTRTTVNGGGSSGSITTVAAFDANGNLVRSVTTSRIPPPPISGGNEFVETEDTRFVIGATMRVCR